MTDSPSLRAPDYAAMSEPKMLKALGDNAQLWAEAFCQIAKKHGHDIDEGWMIGWFANAIERSSEVRALPPESGRGGWMEIDDATRAAPRSTSSAPVTCRPAPMWKPTTIAAWPFTNRGQP